MLLADAHPCAHWAPCSLGRQFLYWPKAPFLKQCPGPVIIASFPSPQQHDSWAWPKQSLTRFSKVIEPQLLTLINVPFKKIEFLKSGLRLIAQLNRRYWDFSFTLPSHVHRRPRHQHPTRVLHGNLPRHITITQSPQCTSHSVWWCCTFCGLGRGTHHYSVIQSGSTVLRILFYWLLFLPNLTSPFPHRASWDQLSWNCLYPKSVLRMWFRRDHDLLLPVSNAWS